MNNNKSSFYDDFYEVENREQKEDAIASAEADLIQEQQQEIWKKLLRDILWNYDDPQIKMERELIEAITLTFCNEPNESYGAYALSNDIGVFGDLEREPPGIVFNLGYAYSYRATLIHELAHILVDYFGYITALGHNGYHCLEFALINYALQWRLLKNHNKHNKSFFRSYDIDEDVAYPNLLISPCMFDSLVKLIEWNTLEDLACQCSKLAEKIRKRAIA